MNWLPRSRGAEGVLAPGRRAATGLFLGAPLVALVVAREATAGHALPVLALLVALGVVVCVLRPVIPAVALLTFGATVFPLGLGPLSIAGVRSDVPELLAGGLVIGWLVRFLIRRERPEGPYVDPVLIIVFSALVGVAWASSHGVSRQTLQGNLKPYLIYLVALALASSHRTLRAQKQLEDLVVGVCSAASAYVLIMVAIGGTVVSEATTDLYGFGGVIDVHRVRPPLLNVLPLALLLVLSQGSRFGWNMLRVLQTAAFTVTLLLGFNRSSWLPLALACVFFVLLRPGNRRAEGTLATALVMLVLLPALYVAAASGAAGPTGLAVTQRIESVIRPSVLTDNSYQDRAAENRTALHTLSSSPVLGVGVGALYGARRPLYRFDLGYYVFIDRPYMHNSYLFAWLQLGLLGLFGIALLGYRLVRTTREALRWHPPEVSARVLAAALALFSNGLAAVFQPYLIHRPAIFATCFALALAQPPREDEPAAPQRDA